MSQLANSQMDLDDWPQHATFQAEPLLTSDGVPVTVAATIAWTRAPTDRRMPLAEESATVMMAAKARLQALAAMSGLAELLSERPLVEGRLCRELRPALADVSLALRAITIDELRIDPQLQAACDARNLSAMRQSRIRRRQAQSTD